MAGELGNFHSTRQQRVVVNGRSLRPRSEWRRVSVNNRRARRRGQRGDLAVAEWLLLLFAYDLRCAYCGRPYETMDHIIPLACGGGTTLTNILPCCRECNQKKGESVWL